MTSVISAEVAALLDPAAATCQLWAEQDEGPYRRDYHPFRRDVTEDRVGVPLALGLALGARTGTAAGDAVVEIWHCDAEGAYSGFPPPDSTDVPTASTAPRTDYLVDHTFLRGRQATDHDGRVEFRTIYPGWYPGRTVHIHVIVRAGNTTFTSQLYFPETVTEAVCPRALLGAAGAGHDQRRRRDLPDGRRARRAPPRSSRRWLPRRHSPPASRGLGTTGARSRPTTVTRLEAP